MTKTPVFGNRYRLPSELAAEVHGHIGRLNRKFEKLFLEDPKLKERYAAAIRAELPPRARPPGHPAQEPITQAERLSRRLWREHPEDRGKPKQHWERVCAALYPDWLQRAPQARRQAKRTLANQVKSRLAARRRRFEKRREGLNVKQSDPP